MTPAVKKLVDKREKLRADNQQLHAAMTALSIAAADEDGREFTDEEAAAFQRDKTTYEVNKVEIDKLTTRIEEIQSLLADASAEAIAQNRQVETSDFVPPPPSKIVVKPPAEDPKRGFKCMGDFATAVLETCRPGGRADQRLTVQAAITGMGQSIGSDGGFLVPPEFSSAIWDGLNDGAESLLPLTDTYRVTGESLTFNANAETSRAAGSRYGGIRGYWLAEGDQMTSSKPTFRQVKLEPQQLAVLVYVTDKLLRNASALDAFVSRAATEEIMFLVNDSIINGTGAGQPLGILTAPCLVSQAKETAQAADTIVYQNVSKMHMRLHSRYRMGARWFINQNCEDQLRRMTIDVGTGGMPVYLPPGGASGQPYGMLFGIQVQPIEYCQTLGDKGDIILANLTGYATGTRGTVESAMSMHLRFDYNESCFRFLFEIDGQPWLASALTPFKGGSGSTTSTFVTLAERA